MGRTAYGVKGITLEEGNEVIGMETITPDSTTAILTVTEKGYGKRTPVGEYRVQGRGGKGIISVKTTERNGLAVGFVQVRDSDEIMLMAAKGKVLRCKVGDIREIGRNTQGVRILDMDGDEDRVVAVARLADSGSGKRRVLTKAPPANNRPLCPARVSDERCHNTPGSLSFPEEATRYGCQTRLDGLFRIVCADLGRNVPEPAGSIDPSLQHRLSGRHSRLRACSGLDERYRNRNADRAFSEGWAGEQELRTDEDQANDTRRPLRTLSPNHYFYFHSRRVG